MLSVKQLFIEHKLKMIVVDPTSSSSIKPCPTGSGYDVLIPHFFGVYPEAGAKLGLGRAQALGATVNEGFRGHDPSLGFGCLRHVSATA